MTFSKYSKFKSINGNILSSDKVNGTLSQIIIISPGVKAAGAVVSGGISASFIIGILASVLLGGSMESMWSMVNTL